MTRLRNRADIDDFLLGLELMSANGGGDPRDERALLYADLDAGLELGWFDLHPDDEGLYCTVVFTGATTAQTHAQGPATSSIPNGVALARPMVEAVQELERHLGQQIAGLIAGELGGINGGAILDAAAHLGIPLVDGDYSGRAIPELMAIAPAIADLPLLPGVFVDHYGNKLIFQQAASTAFAERIGKFLASSSFGQISWALAALPAEKVRGIYVEGTLTRTLELGRAMRDAVLAGGDVTARIAEAMDGTVFFEGVLVSRDWSNTGYMEGFHELDGTGDYEGHRLRLYFRNEHHITWLDGDPFVCSPDLIQACDARTGQPARVETMTIGDQLAVIARRRPDHFDSPQGRLTLAPRAYGFDIDFEPLESLDLSRGRRHQDSPVSGPGGAE